MSAIIKYQPITEIDLSFIKNVQHLSTSGEILGKKLTGIDNSSIIRFRNGGIGLVGDEG